jgi:predicted DNA-binding protein
MPTKNPRKFLAETDGVSLSAKVKDLIKEALEVQEDLYLAVFAEEREKTWDKSKTRTHDEIW